MSTITVKGQVTLPKDLRDAAGLNPGERVVTDPQAAARTH